LHKTSNRRLRPLAATPTRWRRWGEDIGLDDEDEILHPDEAFILSARLDANNVIQTNILMADNIYMYLDKVRIAMVDGEGHALGAISLPKGKKKVDEFLGPTEVIYGQVDVSIPIISDDGASSQFALSYQYQGCVENRICYPPITKYLSVDAGQGLIQVVKDLGDAGGAAMAAVSAQPGDASTAVSEQEQFANLLKDESLLLVVGLFFLAGIGLTFTPCVFPMIPILSSIIAGQGETITTRKAFLLSLIYVLAMAVTYATAGAIVGYYGAEFNIQIWFQDPVILSGFAAVFVLLSLSMFGFYELQMPNAIQSRLTAISNSQQGGTLIGVGLMGFFSAIIVGPCITAPLVGALIFISQTQDWLLGGLALFALGLGMGVPLLLIGTSAGKLLPRAGGWMDSVKAVFGVVLLGVAIWLLERILPVGITMALIAALLIASAIYMGALDSLGEAASGWRRLSKSLGLLILVYGVAYLIGAAAGSNDLIQPLRGLSASSGAGQSQQHLTFRQVKGRDGLQLALNDSVRQNRETMLDFYADWCISCKEMEKYAFTHPQVLAALEKVTALQADVTDNDSIDTELMTSLGIYGPPAILFFDAEGREIRNRRVVGEMSGDQFAAHVNATFQ
jgi:thiol:disulfide interchange protein DsbD